MPPTEPPITASSLLDAEMIEQPFLGLDHVADGDHREIEAVGSAGCRIERGGAGRAHAAAEDVGADDEVAVGVDPLARSDHEIPPARLCRPSCSPAYLPATWESPEKAWATSTALSSAGESRPQVS